LLSNVTLKLEKSQRKIYWGQASARSLYSWVQTADHVQLGPKCYLAENEKKAPALPELSSQIRDLYFVSLIRFIDSDDFLKWFWWWRMKEKIYLDFH
jgi:hypothetical protein